MTLLLTALLMTTTPAMAAPAAATMPNADATISANVMAANDAEIQAGKLAETKATNAQVKSFAQHMVQEHTKNNAMAQTVDQKAKVTPAPDAKTEAMKADSKAKIDAVAAKSGAEFDKAYMNLQVSMHEEVLSTIEKEFLPKAQNADMKKFLTETKAHVGEHLAMAKKIQSSLK